jgi:hypothetical protein
LNGISCDIQLTDRYIVFTNSILEIAKSKKNNSTSFILYNDKVANRIHTESINHYRAGKKEKVFGESICFANLEHENLLQDLYIHNFNYRVIR